MNTVIMNIQYLTLKIMFRVSAYLMIIRYLEVAKFLFTDKNGRNCFDFQARTAIHYYSTRSNTNLILPQPQTNILRNSIFYEGLSLFNDLPTDMKSAHDLFKFKNSLKLLMLSHYINIPRTTFSLQS